MNAGERRGDQGVNKRCEEKGPPNHCHATCGFESFKCEGRNLRVCNRKSLESCSTNLCPPLPNAYPNTSTAPIRLSNGLLSPAHRSIFFMTCSVADPRQSFSSRPRLPSPASDGLNLDTNSPYSEEASSRVSDLWQKTKLYHICQSQPLELGDSLQGFLPHFDLGIVHPAQADQPRAHVMEGEKDSSPVDRGEASLGDGDEERAQEQGGVRGRCWWRFCGGGGGLQFLSSPPDGWGWRRDRASCTETRISCSGPSSATELEGASARYLTEGSVDSARKRLSAMDTSSEMSFGALEASWTR
eukprot:768715-Hanusia_phi.AAC.15